ncbi:MAG: NYN domain-containing protein [Deltaproteobacteria bacterium]|nr:NYN domain-containing protein [Deltaproteobacteria bacterium]
MALRLVIDGYNLLGVLPREEKFGDMETKRDGLIESLSIYKRLRKVKITVVFDGTRSKRLTRQREVKSGIEVVFSKDGEEADRVIKDLASSAGSGLTIVTSDRDISNLAKAKGAVVIDSNEFLGLLDAALYEDLKGVDPEGEDEGSARKKGASRKQKKADRKKAQRIKKL